MNKFIALILSLFLGSVTFINAEEIITQEFTSNTENDWQPLLPTSKSSIECRSVKNDCTFKFENVAQASSGKYLILYPDGRITLPQLDGKISKIEIQLYKDQPFSSICNITINNQQGNRERYLEIDARNDEHIGNFVAFPYDLSTVYPEEGTIFSIISEKKINITGIRISFTPNVIEPIASPQFILPQWMNEDHNFNMPFSLSISTATENAELLYSYDNATWLQYISPIEIEESCTVWAKAVKNARESEISSVTFTRFDNEATDIAHFLEIGRLAESQTDNDYTLNPNPNGLFRINTILQVIAHTDNHIFVSDNTDNFNNCLLIYTPLSNNEITDGSIIQPSIEGYYVTLDDITPALYVNDRIVSENYNAEIIDIKEIVDNPQKYINKYITLKNVDIDALTMNITSNNYKLPIINLFDITIVDKKSINVTGIVTYSQQSKVIGIAPISITGLSSVQQISPDTPIHLRINQLPSDANIYTLNGIKVNRYDVIPGIYIISMQGETPRKALITK